jgi:putative acetyltransferase
VRQSVTNVFPSIAPESCHFPMPRSANLSVRAYQPTDLDAVIAIFQGAIREIAFKDYDKAQIDDWAHVTRARWAERRLSRLTWVAILDQVSVGFADLEPSGHIDMMFVHPSRQGIGVATILLETVEAAADALGILQLFTEASITARPFFEKRGFSVLASEQKGEQLLTTFRMEKNLESSKRIRPGSNPVW